MPGFAALAGARVPERLSLQALVRQSDAATVGKQPLAIGGHEVRHRPAKPDVTMEP